MGFRKILSKFCTNVVPTERL